MKDEIEKQTIKKNQNKKNHSSQCELPFQTCYSCHEIMIALYKKITKNMKHNFTNNMLKDEIARKILIKKIRLLKNKIKNYIKKGAKAKLCFSEEKIK